MSNHPSGYDQIPLSPWWRRAVLMVMFFGFALLSLVTVKTYHGAPPIPGTVVDEQGQQLFAGEDIKQGQEVFLKYGLMEHGSLWGHGAYLGPDYSAEYLHRTVEIGQDNLAQEKYGVPFSELDESRALAVGEDLKRELKQNRFDPLTDTLHFTGVEAGSYQVQQGEWASYFAGSTPAPGLPKGYIKDKAELKHLNAYFAWAAWATTALRPGTDYSYTNNWPYDPQAGNVPTAASYFWSAMSLVTLLGGLGLILTMFGKFEFLGWGADQRAHAHEELLTNWKLTASQKVLGFYFLVVAVLFLAQALLGGVIAHYRVEPGTFYGLDLARILPCSRRWRSWFSAAFSAKWQASTTSWAASGSGWATRAASTWTWAASGNCSWPRAWPSGSS